MRFAMIRADYLRTVCVFFAVVVWALPPPAAGMNNLEEALVQANAKGLPTELLYNAVGLDGRSAISKPELAKALETTRALDDVRKAAVKYAVKDLPTTRESTEGYCSYSWLKWLPFMDCGEPPAEESRQTIQLINANRNCVR